MLIVRSFGAAAFIVGRGIDPLDFDTDSQSFIFADAARESLAAYRASMAKLYAIKDDTK
jgi:hypothetical protein